jgi:non-canonical purine NTP pyrophosphatase (RdgB/HAM1 family)
MKLAFVTGNKGKFKEASLIIPELEQVNLDLVEIQSIEPKEVIGHKIKEARKKVSGSFIVEDNSLSLEALNGLPGSLIKWFLKTIGNKGIYTIADCYNNYKAEAKIVIGYCPRSGKPQYFEGSVKGTIVTPKGSSGFGWDQIFLPEGETKTFAEMTMKEKNKMSMRRIAFQKLKKAIC